MDEQDFRIEDAFNLDSGEQIKAKQYPCDECDYDAKYLNNLKRHKLAWHEGVKSSCDQCSWFVPIMMRIIAAKLHGVWKWRK